MPNPPPMPRIPDINAIAPATRSRGNSSRMIPNASGKIAPPRPWIVRATIMTAIEPAIAPSRLPAARPEQREHEHALFPEHVAEPTGDRRHHRGREQVRGEDPGGAGGRGVEVALQHRERRHDERLEQRVRTAPEGEHAQDQAMVN